MNWCFLGTGGIAVTVAKELLTGDSKIVSLYNRTKSKAEKFSTRFGGTVYDTPLEAISDPSVDAVYIAVTANKHKEFMELCIFNHKPCLCEKPFTVNAREAEEVFALAKRENVYVSEAMWTWHNRSAYKVKELLASGEIGEIQSVELAFSFPMHYFSHNPRFTEVKLIGGALMDTGIYPIRYAYELFGLPRSITCSNAKLLNGVDLHEEILFDYGFPVKMYVARDKMRGEYLKIIGSKGVISSPNFHCTHLVKCNGKKYRDPSLLYKTQFDNVEREIQGEMKKITDKSTIEVAKLLDECKKQLSLVFPQDLPKKP